MHSVCAFRFAKLVLSRRLQYNTWETACGLVCRGKGERNMDHKYKKISFEAAEAILESEPNHRFFDVREEDEYNLGHAKGARLFPVGSITRETAAAQIPAPDTPVLVYCRSGQRSHMAAEKLAALGYSRVYDVGSLAGWPYGIEW